MLRFSKRRESIALTERALGKAHSRNYRSMLRSMLFRSLLHSIWTFLAIPAPHEFRAHCPSTTLPFSFLLHNYAQAFIGTPVSTLMRKTQTQRRCVSIRYDRQHLACCQRCERTLSQRLLFAAVSFTNSHSLKDRQPSLFSCLLCSPS